MMTRILEEVEAAPLYLQLIGASHSCARSGAAVSDSVCCAMRRVGSLLHASTIVCYTSSGQTSLRAARERPESPILSLTPSVATARRLALAWGVHSVHTQDVNSAEEMTEVARQPAQREGFAKPGAFVVTIAGMPFGTPCAPHLLRIATV